MKILYITYDGLSDPLGQSQVLTYLVGLAKRGYNVTIISTEKKSAKSLFGGIGELLKNNNISWHPISYTKKPQVLSTFYDCIKLLLLARRLTRRDHFDIIHCRSYIPGLIGSHIKNRFGLKFIFDMRGFYADERIDGRIWKQSSLLYRMLYKFFKREEQKFLANADYTICLTDRAKNEILKWKIIPGQPIPIKVIPCCADMDNFDPSGISVEQKGKYREKAGVIETDFILMYMGAIGTWYMLDEMFDFFKRLLIARPAKFMFITYDNPENILKVARKKGIEESLIRIVKAKHDEVPGFLSISDLAIFFIKPLYSKMASSPAKQGEIMSMGIPIICNSNIGDSDRIIHEADGGMIIRSFNNEDYDYVVSQIPDLLLKSKDKIRETAKHYFSLEQGVRHYSEVYELLAGKK
ncbi:MAG: glycosyltransferase [Bacteroidetes bacterium]|nr:glycosyltransferase [Bacteroidota bacterium]